MIASVNPALTISHCVNDFASSSNEAQRIVSSEQRMFRDANLLFVTSEKLRQRASRFSRAMHLFPSGVSLTRPIRART